MRPIIDFIIDGKLSALRTWELIPRVGDTVILFGGTVWLEVTRVIWSDGPDKPTENGRQWVQILCKTIEDPTKQ